MVSVMGLLRVRMRVRIAALAAVIAALLGTGLWFAMSGASAQQGGNGSATGTTTSLDTGALRVVSVTPAPDGRDVNGADPVKVVFSVPLAAGSPMPSLSPRIAGSWRRVGKSTVEFMPAAGFTQQTRVKLAIPAGQAGVRSVAGKLLAAPFTAKFRTGKYSTLRLDQLFAQLGYLPLTWSPTSGTGAVPATDENAQLAAAYSPPAGTFTWQTGYPAKLKTLWGSAGTDSEVLHGAVMAFESDHGLTMDGIAGPHVWKAVLRAVDKGQRNSHGYTYALASQHSPETLTVWHNGKKILHTLANTGIAAAPTTVGTAPVYLKYSFQIMRGVNPDGTPYADPVSWVSYFRAGEAVHYFPRASYGFPQSLGCVELPYTQAKFIWPYLTYGTLVTVTSP
jgi:peptidoglycan hydrolase-like protein with peptidoglycan-binding domain